MVDIVSQSNENTTAEAFHVTDLGAANGASPQSAGGRLEIDKGGLSRFMDVLFRHASDDAFIAFRAFPDDGGRGGPIDQEGVRVSAGRDEIEKVAFRIAQFAADHMRPAVFCPPTAGFSNCYKADEASLLEGYALSVELDERPSWGRAILEALLGPATMIVSSGGVWTDPDSGEIQDKLHLHWRLNNPARDEQLALLKIARRQATELVGADRSNIPVSHPIRWPGTWHRKGEPRMARIIAHTENEVDLDLIASVLSNVRPASPAERVLPDQRGAPAFLPYHGAHVEELVARSVPKGQRSEHFQRCINRAAWNGLNRDDTEKMMRRYPNGCAGKYLSPDRLREEIDRSWRKAQKYGSAQTLKPLVNAVDELFSITQDDVARAFADSYRGALRYCCDSGSWFVWQGSHWRQDRTDLAFYRVRLLARKFSEGCAKPELKEVRKRTFAGGVEAFARADPALAVTAADWDRDAFLLGTPDGTVNLQTGELRQPDPRDGITKLTAVGPTTIAECPRWLAFLDETTQGDKEYASFLHQWLGYCLTGDTREHALLFAFGTGGNGKSVFINTAVGILKDYACVAAADTFTASHGAEKHPTDLARLRGARLVVASETEHGKAWAEARIKSLTGGDKVSARFMRQDFFEYQPQFKLTMVGNHKPTLNNVDEALRRRFNIAPFLHTPAVKDPLLEKKLRTEWPGILRWMIEGCLDWQKCGLVRPAVVTCATEEYFAAQNTFAQWLDEDCFVDRRDRSKWTPFADLFSSWTSYAKRVGEMPGSGKAFGATLVNYGFERKPLGHSKKSGYVGIALRSKMGFMGGVFD